ncbi:hypothetical protein MHBO_001292 [Bonamia ostreae]|uniref:Uncharacterized protein n=1 Tax=Bonamia ostreae TaxID=126728 RepID=A0ABV2AJP1_9EUKA
MLATIIIISFDDILLNDTVENQMLFLLVLSHFFNCIASSRNGFPLWDSDYNNCLIQNKVDSMCNSTILRNCCTNLCNRKFKNPGMVADKKFTKCLNFTRLRNTLLPFTAKEPFTYTWGTCYCVEDK